MADLPLFDREPRQMARTSDPETSHQAAAGVKPQLKELQEIVLRVLCMYPNGLTDYEIIERCNQIQPRPYSTYSKRRTELVQAGYVFNTGERRKIAGSTRIVWAPTFKALAFVRAQ